MSACREDRPGNALESLSTPGCKRAAPKWITSSSNETNRHWKYAFSTNKLRESKSSEMIEWARGFRADADEVNSHENVLTIPCQQIAYLPYVTSVWNRLRAVLGGFAGSEGKKLFHIIGWKGRIWQLWNMLTITCQQIETSAHPLWETRVGCTAQWMCVLYIYIYIYICILTIYIYI